MSTSVPSGSSTAGAAPWSLRAPHPERSPRGCRRPSRCPAPGPPARPPRSADPPRPPAHRAMPACASRARCRRGLDPSRPEAPGTLGSRRPRRRHRRHEGPSAKSGPASSTRLRIRVPPAMSAAVTPSVLGMKPRRLFCFSYLSTSLKSRRSSNEPARYRYRTMGVLVWPKRSIRPFRCSRRLGLYGSSTWIRWWQRACRLRPSALASVETRTIPSRFLKASVTSSRAFSESPPSMLLMSPLELAASPWPW